MGAVAKYIQGLLQRGQHHFTSEDAARVLGANRSTVTRVLARLKARGELASPQRRFYIAVPPSNWSVTRGTREGSITSSPSWWSWPSP